VIRERPSPGKPTGLTAALERLADTMAEGRAWMGPRKAAEFMDLRYDEFRKIAPQLPRHEIPQDPRAAGLRPRYRYYAPELTEWMLGR
jgi:hypothetical protein